MRRILASLLLLAASPAFAITVSQNASTASTTPSVAFGSSVAAGSVIFASTQNDANACASETVSDTVNSGTYALLSSSGGNGPCIFWKVANATGTPTVNLTGNSGTVTLQIATVTGFTGTPTADTSIAHAWSGTSSTLSVSPLATNHDNEVYLAVSSYYGGAYGTVVSANWTVISSAPNSPQWNSGNLGYAISAIAGTSIPLSATISASESWYITLGAVYDAGSAPGTPPAAVFPPFTAGLFHGYSQASGGALALSGSPANPAVGSLYNAALTPSGGSGTGYACSHVTVTPNTDQWLTILPNCTEQGIPENNEPETVTAQVTDSLGATATHSFTITPSTSGALTVLTATALPVNATSGGYYAYPIDIKGGSPPYACSWSESQPWQVTPDCWIEGTPTSTGSYTFTSITVTDSAGNTVSYSPTLTIDSTLRFGSVDYATNQLNCPAAVVNAYWSCLLVGYGGSGTLSYSVTSGLPSWASITGNVISGTPTKAGNVQMTVQVADTASHTFSAFALVNVSSAAAVARPTYNSATANGFFVLNGHLYDPNGAPFLCAGVDRDHFDSTSWASDASGALSGANCTREFFGFGQYVQTPAAMATQVTNEYVNNGIVPIVTVPSIATSFTGSISGTTLTVSAIASPNSTGNSGVIVWGPQQYQGGMTIAGAGISGTYYIISQLTGTAGSTGTYQLSASPGTISSESMTLGGSTSNNDDPDAIVAATNELVAAESSLAAVQGDIILNLENEWGCDIVAFSCSNTLSQWQTAVENAISALRTAGYTAPILVDTMNNAEDWGPLSGGQASAILSADTLKNVIFDYHLYNTTSLQANITNITSGTNAVITFSYPGSTNPWSNLTNYNGGVWVSGVTGSMGSSINGQFVTATVGSCSAGSCTLNTTFTTSGTYGGGGTVYDGNHYYERASSLASYIAGGIPIMVGELGPPGAPANSCLASTMNNQSVATSLLIASLKAYGIGYLPWAWDDNDQGGGVTSWDCFFGDTLAGPGTFALNTPSGLTKTGADVLYHPRAGLIAGGSPATVLH